VRHEPIASLGSIETPLSDANRVAFPYIEKRVFSVPHNSRTLPRWNRLSLHALPQRLARSYSVNRWTTSRL